MTTDWKGSVSGSARARVFALAICVLMVLSSTPFLTAFSARAGNGSQEPMAGPVAVPTFMNYIHVNNFSFDPLLQMPAIPDSLSFGSISALEQAYYIVQLKGPVTENMKAALGATGVSILQYISYNAFIVRGDGASIAKAKNLFCTRWVGVFEPGYKISPRLSSDFDKLLETIEASSGASNSSAQGTYISGGLSNAAVGQSTRFDSSSLAEKFIGRTTASHSANLPSAKANRVDSSAADASQAAITVEVLTFEKSGVLEVAKALSHLGARGIVYSTAGDGKLRATIERGAEQALAHDMSVMLIDRYVQPTVTNDIARWVVQSNDAINYSTPVHANGIWGTGQTVTIGDTGIDYQHSAFEDPANGTPGPNNRKVTDYYVPSDAMGDHSDEGIDHGTHTSGTVAGDDGTWHVYDGDSFGSNDTTGPHDGQAFDAKIQMQDLSIDGSSIYPPTNIADMYSEAASRGSYIHTNSWGSSGTGYIPDAMATDQFIWDNQDFLVLYAAGNPGSGLGWVNPFSTAKNVISVGATLNGAMRDDMASFSGRGPASDGRIKPDVTAPGVNIWSAHGDFANDDTYWQLSGTSMATPCMAGSAALVRQYFMDGFYPTGSRVPVNGFTPSAALIKAALINGADEMTGTGAYANGQSFYPNDNQGWGRIDLDNALYFSSDSRGLVVVDDRSGLSTGATATYQLVIGSGDQPVEITLVWSDFPGVAMSDPNLVNDLDLTVHAPDGTVYRGNQYIGFSPAESNPNPVSNDHLNNVEGILVISGAQPGIWTVSVSGFNVPMGPQPFALVMTGAIATQKGTMQMDKATCQSSASINITVVDTGLNVDPNATDTTSVMIWSSTETTPEMVNMTETAKSSCVFRGSMELQDSAVPVRDGLLQVQNGDLITAAYFDANDGLGGSGYVFDYALVDDSPPIISGIQIMNLRFNRATVEWGTDEPSDSVVYWGSTLPPTSTVRNARLVYNHSISLTRLAENTTYYLAVQSTDEAGNTAYDDNGTSFYWFTTPVRPPIAPPSNEWPTFHNNEPRQGVSPSNFLPPVQQMWSDGPHTESLWSGPVMSDGLLYLTSMDGFVRARDPTSGDVIWERSLGEPYSYTSSPTVANGVVYVTMATSNTSTVYALDGLTGDTIWADDSYFYSTRNVMSCSDGLVFPSTETNEIVALDASTGTVEWVYNAGAYPVGGATVTGGVLYQAMLDFYTYTGLFVALDESSGALLWSEIVDNIAVGPPLYAQGNVYIGTYSGTMYALDAADGSIVWKHSGYNTIDFGTPAYDGGAIYYCDMGGSMFALDATDGSLIWNSGVGSGSASAPAYANGYLYIASHDGNLYTVDSFDGTVVGSDYLGPGSTSSPAVSDGWIWVEANDGTVIGFLGQLPVGMILSPTRQAMDGVPDSHVDYLLNVTNVGYLGPDTFDVTLSLGGLSWTVELFASDGVTQLTDTDGDGTPDTGPLNSWQSAEVIVRITVPAGALGGDSDETMITFTSSTDSAVSKVAVVATTVPPPGVEIGPSVYIPASAGDVFLGFLNVQNLGGFPDTMDITSSDSAGWNYSLVQSDGVTPLADTDHDGIPDTGELPGLGSVLIGVVVDVPMSAPEGSVDRITVRAASSLDPFQVDSAAAVAEIAPPQNVEWPTYHNNDARTGASPSQFSPPLVMQWADYGSGLGAVVAGPVMADSILFSTSYDGYIRARDPYTGAVLWGRALGGEYYYPGTPAVDGGLVYATFYGSSGGYVYALDELSGNLMWSVGMSSGLDFSERVQMTATDGLVYGATWNGYVYALDESDGSVAWSYRTGGNPCGGVAIGGGMAFIGSQEGYLYAFDKDTGTLQWSTFLVELGAITSAPLYAQGNIYIGTSSGSMFAVDAASGTIVWQAMMNAPISFSTPAYDGTAIFFGTLGGMFYALDPVDGSVKWSTPVGESVYCSPAYAHGYLYTTVWDGEFVTLDATDGTIVDSQYIGSYSFTTSPAVSDGWVWINDYMGSVFGLMGQMPYGVRVVPATQSKDVYPPAAADFEITVTNIGDFGPDTFDVNVTLGVHGWLAQLYEVDGVTPLPDTDGDSVPDTGSLATGANATIVVRVDVPGTSAASDIETTTLTFTSSNDPTTSKDVSVICEVPPPGAKVGPNVYAAVTKGMTALANMTVTNTGGFADTIDVVAGSAHGWNVSLFQADGVTPLVDTNGDHVPDTGLIGGGVSLPIVIAIEVPADASNGTLDHTDILASSSADPSAIDEAAVLCEVSSESAVDWPQFQHDAARSGISPVDVELPFVEKWYTQPFYDSPNWFCPVIHAGTVFYSTRAGYMVALDLLTGDVKWETLLGVGVPPSGPTVAYGNVYVAFAKNWSGVPTLYCLDEDTGTVIWSADAYNTGPYLYASVVAAQGMVFWHDNEGDTLYANDAFTGTVLWTYVMDGMPCEGPAYWSGMVFLADSAGKVVAIDALTGEEVWSAYLGSTVSAPLSMSHGVLYFGDYNGNVHALDALTGEVRWTTSLSWSMDKASPVVAEGMVYIGVASMPNGTIYALNESTGSIVWSAYASGGPFDSSAEYSNGIVFCTAQNGHLYAWDALTGALLQDQVVASGAMMSSAALANGYIVVCDMWGGVTAYGFKGVGEVDHISVSPASADLGVMRTAVFEAHAYDRYGNEVTDGELRWSSLNGLGSVVRVSDDGTRVIYFAGSEAGQDTVRVTFMDQITDASVNILAGPVQRVTVTPASASVVIGDAVQFSANVEDLYGNAVPGANITWSVNGGIGIISDTGLFTAGLVAGTGTVEASCGGMVGVAAVTVLPGELDNIIITPDEFSLAVGAVKVLHAQGYDAHWNAIPGLSYVWLSTVGNVTPTSAEGEYAVFSAGLTAGTGTVSAASGGLTASALVAVLPGAVSSIVLSPASPSLVAGATQSFAATALDVFGNEISDAALKWSANSEIGTITQAGVLTASTVAGSGTVSVSVGSVSASALVTILPGTATMTILPGGLTARAGTMVSLEVITADSYGNVVQGLTYTWTCTIGSVFVSGDSSHVVFVAGNDAGLGTVTVTDGSNSMTLSANVNAGSLAYIVVQPSVISVDAGGNALLTAKGYDAFGNEVSGLTFAWTLSDQKLGDIVTFGTHAGSARFEASGGGSGTITVSSGGVSSQVGLLIAEKAGALTKAAPSLSLIAIILVVAVMILVIIMLWRSRGAKPA